MFFKMKILGFLILCSSATFIHSQAVDGGCAGDRDCSLTEACLEGTCSDPCLSTECPMKGGLCKVVGHRPVCSCPPGHVNKDMTCVQDSNCKKDNLTYSDGETFYDDGCKQRCECHLGSLLCEETVCAPGLLPRGFLDPNNDPQCQEREHQAGDECCVRWVCSDQEEPLDHQDDESDSSFKISDLQGVCENVVCGSNAMCEPTTGRCSCLSGYTGNAADLVTGCSQEEKSGSNIKLLQITSNSIQIQFPDITGGNLMYVSTKLVGRKDPPWENAIILEGNEIFTLTGLEPGTQYTLRWKAPDRQYSDVQVATLAPHNTKPKVIVTNTTHESVRLVFDQFRPEGYTNGYVVSWKEVPPGEGENELTWESKEMDATGDLPTVEIKDLKPSTTYTAKISIYADYANRLLGGSTEEIEFSTLPGCIYNSTNYAIGKFFVGCESACECKVDGEVVCTDRCSLPLHPRGGFAEDPLCVERTVDETKCCVLVTCASAGEDEDSPCQDVNCGPNAECKHEVLRGEEAETICVCKEGYTGDPDSQQGCSLASAGLVETSPAPACLANNNTYSRGESWFDGCDFKCSCSPSLEIICQPRCKVFPEDIDSECELAEDPEDPCCKVMICSDKSNATNIVQPSIPFDGCVFKNSTYKEGERFYDGCAQQCQCMGFGDLVCLARCPPTNPEVGENCYTLPDLTDACCNVTVCDKIEENEDVEKIPEVDLILDNQTTTVGSEVETTENDNIDETTIAGVDETTTDIFAELSDDEAETTTQTVVERSTEPFLLVDVSEETTTTTEESDEVTVTEVNQPAMEKRPRVIDLPEKISLGSFVNHFHGIQGEVFAVNDTVLFIKGFSYDGQGPDAFFYVGGSDRPSGDGIIVPYPYSPANLEDPPVLDAFYNEDVYLRLPPGLHATDLRWISVWCRAFSANFGDLIWGDKLTVKPEVEETVQTEAVEGSLSTAVTGCTHGDSVYSVGEQFYDGCKQFCVCQENFATMCFEIECPHEFGLDVMSPNCILWDNHEDFEPSPPTCCPPVPTCLSTGSCEYKNVTFANLESLPMELTGCEQSCHCTNSEVVCQDACYELSPTPPRWLPCNDDRAVLVPSKDRPCCNNWDCAPEEDDGCSLLPRSLKDGDLKAVNSSSILITWNVPESAILHKGYFQIAYSSSFGGIQDHNRWPTEKFKTETGKIESLETYSRVFSPLLPDTEYFIRPSIVIEDCKEETEIRGDITTVRTLPVGPVAEEFVPEVVYLDLGLVSSEVSHTSARISWRHFEPEEKQYVDGLQLRYQILRDDIPVSQVPLTSPFIHRDTNYFVFENLKPETKYEVELDIIPVPGSQKELYSGLKLEFTTQSFTDVYDFEVELMVAEVWSNSVEVAWSGVPSPDQKFVNIYRVIYHSNSPNSVRDETSVFKISKIDSPKRMLVTDLQPDQEYQIWLEAYLTNGEMKKSNVAEFHTSVADESSIYGAQPATKQQDGGEVKKSDDDYYQSMVAVAIVATFAILAFLIVLYFYLRRNVTYTHTINKGRPSSASSYENNGFKDNASVSTGQSIEMDGMSNGNGVNKHNP